MLGEHGRVTVRIVRAPVVSDLAERAVRAADPSRFDALRVLAFGSEPVWLGERSNMLGLGLLGTIIVAVIVLKVLGPF
jgi:hypothetical protein